MSGVTGYIHPWLTATIPFGFDKIKVIWLWGVRVIGYEKWRYLVLISGTANDLSLNTAWRCTLYVLAHIYMAIRHHQQCSYVLYQVFSSCVRIMLACAILQINSKMTFRECTSFCPSSGNIFFICSYLLYGHHNSFIYDMEFLWTFICVCVSYYLTIDWT